MKLLFTFLSSFYCYRNDLSWKEKLAARGFVSDVTVKRKQEALQVKDILKKIDRGQFSSFDSHRYLSFACCFYWTPFTFSTSSKFKIYLARMHQTWCDWDWSSSTCFIENPMLLTCNSRSMHKFKWATNFISLFKWFVIEWAGDYTRREEESWREAKRDGGGT